VAGRTPKKEPREKQPREKLASKAGVRKTYTVTFKPEAERNLKKIKDRRMLARLVDAIAELSDDPRPAGVKALQGDPSILRLRVGDYRVLYTVTDRELIVAVVTLGHRREVYR
jgi:mRNA interferase RelE/StbE